MISAARELMIRDDVFAGENLRMLLEKARAAVSDAGCDDGYPFLESKLSISYLLLMPLTYSRFSRTSGV